MYGRKSHTIVTDIKFLKRTKKSNVRRHLAYNIIAQRQLPKLFKPV